MDNRITKLNEISADLDSFEKCAEAFKRSLVESECDIDEYRKYIATTDDVTTVRNAFLVCRAVIVIS